ncbi:MAG: adenylosuccinate lyase [Candidatus Peribacteraceae bacterium]
MQPLSPLDGRYAARVHALRPFFTEDALIRARIFVEVSYFGALAQEKEITELKALSARQKKALQEIVDSFDEKEAQKVREIEKVTNHDVKAVEYYLRRALQRIGGAKMKTEFLHFALTSEDVNNLAYGILIQDALRRVLRPELQALIVNLRSIAAPNMHRRMLSLTHGQPATPTTLGKEIMVFIERLEKQRGALSRFTMDGKFGGAVGNYFAHRAAYPDVHWEAFGRKFIRSLKLEPLKFTTQINPHDDIAELSHLYVRINTILIDLARDIWMYVSRGIFRQQVTKSEVGSSTMPHKINPIDFENAEGNLGISSALFDHFALKLPISRLQRDLSDSTVQRNLGIAFGYHLLSLESLRKGLKKLSVDKEFLSEELHAHPEVLTEAIQTVMRKNGMADAYERLKALSRGKRITFEDLEAFIKKLEIDRADKARLLKLIDSF